MKMPTDPVVCSAWTWLRPEDTHLIVIALVGLIGTIQTVLLRQVNRVDAKVKEVQTEQRHVADKLEGGH